MKAATTRSFYRAIALCASLFLLLAVAAWGQERIPNLPGSYPKKAVTLDLPDITIATDSSLRANELAQTLVGPGVTISNVTANCAAAAQGKFTVTGSSDYMLTSGIILSSGEIANVIGPNNSPKITGENGTSGDADLNLLAGQPTLDACVLEFDFVPQSSVVSFQYLFGSDEYNEFVDTQWNDVFGFFINGQNCAVVNGGPVSINAINNGLNAEFFVDNEAGDINTELDGFTTILTCTAVVTADQTNHIKLAVADASDSQYDSNVFIGAGSLQSADYAVQVTPPDAAASANNTTTVWYPIEITNLGGKSDTFTVAIDADWPAYFGGTGTDSTTVGPLAPLEKMYLYVAVVIPQSAANGSTDTATVTVTSQTDAAVTDSSVLTTTANGTDCVFIRELPSYYIPAIPMGVSILAVPTCVPMDGTFSLEELVPSGWTASGISNGGQFDAVTHAITWAGLPSAETPLTYTITPTASDAQTFSGSSTIDGTDYSITGDATTTAKKEGYHPADANANLTIGVSEFTPYGAAWLTGKEWPNGWNPVTIGFAVKAAAIWKSLQPYHYAAVGVAPDCWVVGTGATAATASSTAVRTVSDVLKPGEPVNVSITVTPGAGVTAFAYEESPPDGWTIDLNSIVTDKGVRGVYDAPHKKVKWKIFTDNAPRTLTYTVFTSADATPPAKFTAGVANFDGNTELAVADTSQVTDATLPGAPTIGTATAGNARATVSFTAPADNGGSMIYGYTVTSNPGNITATGAASPVTVTGLTNGTAYTFTVQATNWVGTGPASAASNSVTPATIPGVPLMVTATGGNGKATVRFTAPANNGSAITGYTVTSNPGKITVKGTASPITVPGLKNGTAYTFTVKATNGLGTGPSSTPSNSVTPLDVTLYRTARAFYYWGGAGSVGYIVRGHFLEQITVIASSNVPWITIDPGYEKTVQTIGLMWWKDGRVKYRVRKNESVLSRTGKLTIGGQDYIITQRGAPCQLVITPAQSTFTRDGGTGSVSVSAPAGCGWTATVGPLSTISNLALTGSPGNGKGVISFTVPANSTGTALTGKINFVTDTIPTTRKSHWISQAK